MTAAVPVPPAYDLGAIFTLRDRLADYALLEVYGCPLVGETFARAVHLVARSLPADVSPQALRDSMSSLLGQELTRRLGFELAWRLAGNLPALRAGHPTLSWQLQDKMEWVPLQVLASRFTMQRQRPGQTFRFQLLAGSPCPARTTAYWSRSLCSFLAPRLGFSSRRGKLPWRDGSEFVQLRLLGLLEPRYSRGQPGFRMIHCPPSLLQYNRRVLRLRVRQGFTCPHAYVHPCCQCPVGYRECPAGVHPYNFELRACSGCDQETWFDPDPNFRSSLCIHCQPLRDAGLKTPSEKTVGKPQR